MKKNGLFRTLVCGVCLVAIFCSSSYIYIESVFKPQIDSLTSSRASLELLSAKFVQLNVKTGWYWDEIERLNAQAATLEEKALIAKIQLRVWERQTKREIIAIVEAYDESFAEAEAESDALLRENRELKVQLKKELRGEWAGLRDFENRAEFFDFTTSWNSAIIYKETDFDCTEYSYMLMRDAAEEGFRLYPMILFELEGNRVVSSHLLCMAVVHETIQGIEDDWIYALEPQHMIPNLVGRLGDRSSWITKWWKLFP